MGHYGAMSGPDFLPPDDKSGAERPPDGPTGGGPSPDQPAPNPPTGGQPGNQAWQPPSGPPAGGQPGAWQPPTGPPPGPQGVPPGSPAWQPPGSGPWQPPSGERSGGSLVLGLLIGVVVLVGGGWVFVQLAGQLPDQSVGLIATSLVIGYLVTGIVLAVRPRTSRYGAGLLLAVGATLLILAGLCFGLVFGVIR